MANGNIIPTGLLGSEEALRAALAGSTGAVQAGLAGGQQIGAPFVQGGQQAFDLQAALSGAAGPEAQAERFREFRSSPGQEFLRTEAERSLLRNQAAIGGLGGGNVRRALQEQAIGLASQDFGNQFNRLGQVAGQGGQFAQQRIGQELDVGALLSGLQTRAGEGIAGGRTQAGRDISSIIGQGSGNLANILSGSGQAVLGGDIDLATLLANIGTGQASNLTGQAVAGSTPGRLTDIAKIISALGTL